MRVEVYWNLHKKCWSVRHKGKVIQHRAAVQLKDVTWVVQPAGNRRVRREGKKNVHAFARGTLLNKDNYFDHIFHHRLALTKRVPVIYNPYKHTSFVLKHAPDMPCEWSDFAALGAQYFTTTDTYQPVAYVYNWREPTKLETYESDWNRYDQGPRS